MICLRYFSVKSVLEHFLLPLPKEQRKNARKAPENYQNLCEEEKQEKWQYGCERYKYLSFKTFEKWKMLHVDQNI